MGKKHAKLVKDTLDYLNSLSCCKAFPVYPGPWGNRGVIDVIFCYCGLFGSIEIKIGYDSPSKLQKIFMRDVINAGGEAQVGRALDDVKELVRFMDMKFINNEQAYSKQIDSKLKE